MPLLSSAPPPLRTFSPSLGLYAHIPFCETKCSYCSFNSIPSEGDLHEAFTQALCHEIRNSPRAPAGEFGLERGALPPVATAFFGGGTPSLLTPDQLGRILTACRQAFAHARGPDEVTLECNPGTVDASSLAALRDAGFSRASFGAQSFDDADLRALGRIHAAADIGRAVRDARAAGFDRISLDLIFALPGQTLDRWRANLRAAVELGTDHVSCYMLQFDPGTPLTAAMLRGEVRPLDDELQRDMLYATVDDLTAAGLPPYEISNYARPGFECRHNLAYWSGTPYLGFGPGAHSFWNNAGEVQGPQSGVPSRPDLGPGTSDPGLCWGLRWSNLAGVEEYVRRASSGASVVGMREDLTRRQRMFETAFLGLRQTRGIDVAAFAREFGEPLDAVHGATVARLEQAGLVERSGGCLRLTRRGLAVADAVMAEFA